MNDELVNGDRVRVRNFGDLKWQYGYFVNYNILNLSRDGINPQHGYHVRCIGSAFGSAFTDNFTYCERYDWDERDLKFTTKQELFKRELNDLLKKHDITLYLEAEGTEYVTLSFDTKKPETTGNFIAKCFAGNDSLVYINLDCED
jgi:hypothetical protein